MIEDESMDDWIPDPDHTGRIMRQKCGKGDVFTAFCLNRGAPVPLSSFVYPHPFSPINTYIPQRQRGYDSWGELRREF